MTDEQSLLRAVLDSPGDDLPRLVYADWLDEHGESDRAEFIRVQCEAAALKSAGRGCDESGRPGCCPPEYARLRARESHLWGHGFGGLTLRPPLRSLSLHAIGTPAPGELPKGIVRRGFVDEVRLPLAAFLAAGPCGRCSGDGSVGDLYDPRVRSDCDRCGGTGRAPGVAAALFRSQPIAEVVLTDRMPMRFLSQFRWGWNWLPAEADPTDPEDIPEPVWDLLKAQPGAEYEDAGAWVFFPTNGAAHAALSAAGVAHGRDLAGLPPLPRPGAVAGT